MPYNLRSQLNDWSLHLSSQCGLSRSGQVSLIHWIPSFQAWYPSGQGHRRYEIRKQPSTTAWLDNVLTIQWSRTSGPSRYYGSLSLVGLITCLYQVMASLCSYTQIVFIHQEEWWAVVHDRSRLQEQLRDLQHAFSLRLWCAYDFHAWNLTQPYLSPYRGGIIWQQTSYRCFSDRTAHGRCFQSFPHK